MKNFMYHKQIKNILEENEENIKVIFMLNLLDICENISEYVSFL